MIAIAEWELDDCGADHEQYFQRVRMPEEGVYVFLGAGNTPYEAAQDAIEQAGVGGYDVSAIENTLSDKARFEYDEETGDFEDWYHYVALYIKDVTVVERV